MKTVLIVATVVVALPLLAEMLVGAVMHLRLACRPREEGERAEGLVIFVEGIRWLGVRWDHNPALAGLRRAGYRGRIVYRQWQEAWRAWLVLPAICDAANLERCAGELAERIARERREHPAAPLHVMGISLGGYVALRALELLPPEVRVDSAVVLSAAVDPRRDLTVACSRVSGRLVVAAAGMDWLVLGLGTLVVGTGDRRHTPSMGMIGPQSASAGDLARRGKLAVVTWRPAMIGLGHLGGHFSAASPAYVARHVAPLMGLAAKE